MATSVTTAAHGVRVVTHIIPMDAPEPPCPTESKPTKEEPSLPYMTRMFLKGEPVALGTLQVLIGLVIIAVKVITIVSRTLNEIFPLYLGILWVVCGSVTLAGHKGTSLRLIKSTLGLNIIGTLLGISGIGYICIELAMRPNLADCNDDRDWTCRSMVWRLTSLLDGLNGMMLVLSVLGVCVCITLVVFSCKARRPDPGTSTVVKVQTSDLLCKQSNDALLTGKDDCNHPPAYEP